MDQLTAQEESTYRTLRRVVNITAAIVFTLLFAGIGYGFYCFGVSRLDLGERLHIDASAESGQYFTCETAPLLVIHYRGIPSKSIRAKLDDRELKLSRQGLWGTLSVQLEPLEDGEHRITVLAGPYRGEWTFTVDTVPPTMDLRGPIVGAVTAKDSVTFYGRTKPFALVAVKLNDKTYKCEADEQGLFKTSVAVGQGINTLKWMAADRAGNTIGGKRSVVCDMTPPSVEPALITPDETEQATPKNNGFVFSQRDLILKLTVKDADTGIRSTQYVLDARPVRYLPIPDDSQASGGAAEDEDGNEDEDSAGSGSEEDADSGSSSEALDEIPGDDAVSSIEDASFVQTQAPPGEVSDSMPDGGSSEQERAPEAEASNEAETAPTGTADDAHHASETVEDRPQPEPAAAAKPLEATVVKAVRVKGEPLLPHAKGRCTEYLIPLNKLCDGDHTLSITSINGVGTPNKRVIKFGVNSTDKFGEATLCLGASGSDVAELQKRLVKRGYLEGTYSEGVYDEPTCAAVKALQKHIGINPDGVCGPQVYGAIDKRIYVNLSRYEAKLVTEDEQVYTYPICIGVDEHPTPTGWFYVADMAKDPTWLPPNSEWAKNAKAIDPGPDNPLGTRWIGLNVGSVGFHGTPYPDSVGTKASHGCMRMRLVDIEDLYDRVTVGTQVRIYSGSEDDHALHHYWH